MQIGIRLHDAQECPFEQRLSLVKAQGFSCVHFALKKTTGLAWRRENLTPGYAAYLKHAFQKAGLDVAVLGCYLNLADPDEDFLSETKRMYTAHLRLASLMGAGMVGTETGAPNHAYRYDRDACRSEKALETFIRNLSEVVRDAERFGVILAIEPVYCHIVWNGVRARKVLDSIASPNLQIILDPVNLIDPQCPQAGEETIAEAIDLLSDEIALIHLKDYRLESGTMSCMACGLGEMDYRPVLKFARDHKPYIQATLENTKPENAAQAAAYIRGVYDSLSK